MLSQREIFRKALDFRKNGRLYDVDSDRQENDFRGSIDRFCWIAREFQGKQRVLDIGAGNGILLSLLHELGHECHALDVVDQRDAFASIYRHKNIAFNLCNVEADPIPYPDGFFDALSCCQALEHFSHAHLPAVQEMHRVLKPGGIIELDVPNVVCFRNRWRMIRGKNITWDYEKHYLREKPILYKGMSFFPDRHNREFTLQELRLLLEAAGFRKVRVFFMKSRRYRTGLSRIRGLGSMLRDAVPSLRKSLIAFAEK